MTSKFFCWFLASLLALSVACLGQSAKASYGQARGLVQTRGQPMVAYLEDREFGGKQSFALGCPALISLWAPWVGGPIDSDGGQPYSRSRGRFINPNTFNRILREYPVVADLPCDGSIQRYTPAGEPGAVVVLHRNGQYYRHYVDSPEHSMQEIVLNFQHKLSEICFQIEA